MASATRTYLCDECDGTGVKAWNNGPSYAYGRDPQFDEECDCGECDGTGVIQATYAVGDQLGLQPWNGKSGRALAGERASRRQRDPLLVLANNRVGQPNRSAFYYSAACRDAFRPALEALAEAERGIAGRDLRANWERIGWERTGWGAAA